jgi:hypothetical protein
MGFMQRHYSITRVCLLGSLLLLSANLASAATDSCVIGAPLTGGKQHCSSNSSGKMGGGYTWTIWSSGGGGCITTYDSSGCAFKATWNNSGDFLARTGLGWNETKTFSQLGTIAADYAFKKTGSGGSWSFIGIYGWSNSPLVEYYIVEDWFGSGSAPNIYGGAKKGSFTVDGETYNIVTHTQSNQPSIHGNATFPQFFSVRAKPRQCGHISISEHFKKWDSLGLKLGKMYEARILVEASGGSGSLDFTKATLTAGDPTTAVSPAPETPRSLSAFRADCKGSGVLSLVSLNGAVVRSVRQNGSRPATIPTGNMAKGLYILQFKGDGKAPAARTFLVK